MTPVAPVLGLATLTGLALGSYAVTGAIRFARREPSAVGRSHCDSCDTTLSFAQTIPVISYLRARGVCQLCRGRIDPLHLVGELAGLTVVLTACLTGDVLRAGLLSILGLALLAAAVIDWKIGRLPNLLTTVVAAAGLVLAAMKSIAALEAGLAAALLAFALLQALRWGTSKVRGDPGLGFGDVKLICALALWLGVTTPWMVVAAAVAGLGLIALHRPKNGRLAFGPAIAAAGWLIGVGGEYGLWPTTA